MSNTLWLLMPGRRVGICRRVEILIATTLSLMLMAAVARMAAGSTIKLAEVQPYLDRQSAVALVATHYGEAENVAAMQVAQAEMSAMQAGF